MTRHLRNQWAGLLALFLVVTGAGAYAAFDPIGGDGDVDACFERKTGDLDLLKGKKCGKREKPISWDAVAAGSSGSDGQGSAQGPQGPPGAQGTEGPPGPAGSPAASMMFGTVDAADMPPDNSFDVYFPSGRNTGSVGLFVTGISPNAPVVLRDLSAWVTDPPGPGGGVGVPSWTIEVGVRSSFTEVDPSISCQISGNFTQSCDSGGQTATIPPGSGLVLLVDRRNGPPAATLSFGYRATTP